MRYSHYILDFSQSRKYRNRDWCVGLKKHLFYNFQIFTFLIAMYRIVSNLVNQSCLYLSRPWYVLLVNLQLNFNVPHKKNTVVTFVLRLK